MGLFIYDKIYEKKHINVPQKSYSGPFRKSYHKDYNNTLLRLGKIY